MTSDIAVPDPKTIPPTSDAPSVLSRSGAEVRHRQRERRRLWGRRARQLAVGALLLAAFAVVAWAMRPRPVPVDVATTRGAPLSLVIDETGVARVKDRFVVSAPVTGSLSRLGFEPGDKVREGDALAEIAPVSSPLLDQRTRAEAEGRLDAAGSALGQAKAQVARAATAREQAEQELQRTRHLTTSGALSQQALEQAEFLLRLRTDELSSAQFAEKIAKEELRIARVTLGKHDGGAGERHIDVLAPASGEVLRVHQKSAAVVQAGTPLVEVGDRRGLELVIDLLTTDAVSVSPGTPVTVSGWGGDPLSGRVSRVEPAGFTRPSALGVDEQRVNVIVTLTDPPERWQALGDGYRVEARLTLWRGEHVLQVPSGAVFRRGEGWAAFRVVNEVARLTSVRLGHRGESAVEVLSGLSAGDSVIVHPGDRVKDGVKLQVNP